MDAPAATIDPRSSKAPPPLPSFSFSLASKSLHTRLRSSRTAAFNAALSLDARVPTCGGRGNPRILSSGDP